MPRPSDRAPTPHQRAGVLSRLGAPAWLVVCGALVSSCRPCAHDTFVSGLDGGTASCVQAIDCPRESNLLVCTDDLDPLRGCVDCIESQCVRFTPGACP